MMFARKFFGSVIWFFSFVAVALVTLALCATVALTVFNSAALYQAGLIYGPAIVLCLAFAAIAGSTFGTLPFTRHETA